MRKGWISGHLQAPGQAAEPLRSLQAAHHDWCFTGGCKVHCNQLQMGTKQGGSGPDMQLPAEDRPEGALCISPALCPTSSTLLVEKFMSTAPATVPTASRGG